LHAAHTLTATTGLRVGLVLTALGFGLRHGIDWDHIAALTDITASQTTRRRAMMLSSCYALGHAAVVFALGLGVILFSAQLPGWIDPVMERFVGVTLLALGMFVLISLRKHERDFRMRSRWMLIIAAGRALARCFRRAAEVEVIIEHEHAHASTELRSHHAMHTDATLKTGTSPRWPHPITVATHSHRHRHIAPMPADPFPTFSVLAALGVGALHGIGAETPTQVLIFVAAAGVGDKGPGVLLLTCFLIGLLVSNTAVAITSTAGFLSATRNARIYAAVSLLTAVFSLVIGTLFVLGQAALLPAILGG
jgi:high-affinity nickel-transport protein